MISLESRFNNQEDEFTGLKKFFEERQFSLGGNWDYDHGYFDRALDDDQKVWLRIPFQVTSGAIDGSVEDSESTVRLGQPFVLRHLYQEGSDPEAHAMTYRGFIDQFQTPTDRDAEVGDQWVAKAKQVLQEAERGYLQ